MTTTYTVNETKTYALYIAGKVAADLLQFHDLYGYPKSKETIDDYAVELGFMLTQGFVKSVDYGLRRDDKWVLAINYLVLPDGSLSDDQRSGSLPSGVDITSTEGYSYMRYTDKWFNLPPEEKLQIKSVLPVKRTTAPEPMAGDGGWVEDKFYSHDNKAVARKTFRPLS